MKMALAIKTFDTTVMDKYWGILGKHYNYLVYLTKNLKNGKLYVGQSVRNNPNYYGSGSIITKALKKYEKQYFYKKILCFCSSKKEMDEKEQFYIRILKTKTEFGGYNITDGGSGALGFYNPKYSIEDLQNHAIEHDGICLSKVYINYITKYHWKCNVCGYDWWATWGELKFQRSWCPKCANSLSPTIEEVIAFIESKEGIYHSEKYINNRIKLDLECKRGHPFQMSWNKVQSGSWCPKCAKVKPLTIEEVIAFIKNKEGICHSEKYINARSKLDLECKRGHPFKMSWNSVHQGKWCPKCARKSRIGMKYKKHKPKKIQISKKKHPNLT